MRASIGVMNEFPTCFHIGTQKAGSTYLYNLLDSHSAVVLSEKTEINFFNNTFDKGPSWYKSLFPNTGTKIDISPTYFKDGNVVASRIRDFYEHPDELRFVLILRNPVDYLASHFRMHKLHGYFEKHRDMYPKQSKEITTFLEMYPTYADNGKYYTLFAPWLKYFSRQQFHVVLFEEFIRDTDTALKEILSFWEIPYEKLSASAVSYNATLRSRYLHKAKTWTVHRPQLKNTLKRSALFSWVYKNMLTKKTEQILSPQERAVIAGYVKEDVAQLSQLGIDTSMWKDFN